MSIGAGNTADNMNASSVTLEMRAGIMNVLRNESARLRDARLSGAGIGTVQIDPYAFGLSIGRRFGNK